jgi:hypothetical protein
MSKVFLGETRPDAITRVQELLGPMTTRPIAEKTFWALAEKGKITLDRVTGAYLMEEEVEQPELKNEAKTQVQKQGHSYIVNRNHFRRARIAWMWKARQASVFSPSLLAAGVTLDDDGYSSPDDDSEDE